MKSFNPKSVAYYRKLGYHTTTCDKPVMFKKFGKMKVITKDLFGFADVLAFSGELVILCQATSRSNLASRIRKASEIAAAQAWVDNPHRVLEFHGWYKIGGRWHVKIKTLRFQRTE